MLSFLISAWASFFFFNSCQFWSSQVLWLLLPQPLRQRLLIPFCVLYFPDSFVLDTAISTAMAGMKVDFSCHCSRGAGRSVCWTDTTPCTAELRCERSRTVRTGHKRHTNALKGRFGYFTATVKEGESSILSNNLLDSECLVYFTQHASPNMCSSQPRET